MSMAMREAFGKHLAEIGKDHPEMIVLDADVSSSTKSAIFGKAFPERFFNVGVAEGNLAGVAAGLATCGYHPVINAFAIFLSLKSTDQIRNDMCYNSLPCVIAGAYAIEDFCKQVRDVGKTFNDEIRKEHPFTNKLKEQINAGVLRCRHSEW